MNGRTKFEKLIFFVGAIILSVQILKAAGNYVKLAFLSDGIWMKILLIDFALLISSFVPSAILTLMGNKLKHKTKMGVLYRLIVQVLALILLSILIAYNIFYFLKNPEGNWTVLIVGMIFLVVTIYVVSKSINDYLTFKNDIE